MVSFRASSSLKRPRKRPFFYFFLFFSFWIFLGLGALFFWLSSILPPLETLKNLKHKASIAVLDSEGKLLTTYGEFHGDQVHVKDLPKHVIYALLAIEDRRFYHHFGVDPLGIIRAAYSNFKSGQVRQGASTITQQLAKNFLQKEGWFTYKDRSLKRKICEFVLALKIEFAFSKDDILTMYLNTIYMGAGTWGIDAASLKYFGRHAKDLRLYDAALLMGLLRAPSKYSPSYHRKRSESRAKQVLDAMVEAKFLKPEAAKIAMSFSSPLQKNLQEQSFLYFTDWVMDEIQDLVDTEKEDLIVTTTLNSDLQNLANYQSQKVMENYGKKWKAKEQAFLSMTPDGAVVAMIGGRNYSKSPFNRATQSLRQPGSAFKYFVFLTALEEGMTPESFVSDVPITLDKWKAKNFKYRSVGEITLETAFAKSVNASAIHLIIKFGVRRVIEMARRLGIQGPIRPDQQNYTLALGTLGTNLVDMVSAFGAVANKGSVVRAYGIQRIMNKKNQILYEREKKPLEPVLDKEIVREMRQLMKAVMTKGTGRLGQIPKMDLYGKTGTSNKGSDDRDLWKITLGYFPKTIRPVYPCLISGAWTGNDDEKAMKHQNGGSPSLHLVHLFNTSAFVYQMNQFQEENQDLWKKQDYKNIPGLDGALDKKLLEDIPEDEGEGEDDEEENEEEENTEEDNEENFESQNQDDQEDQGGDGLQEEEILESSEENAKTFLRKNHEKKSLNQENELSTNITKTIKEGNNKKENESRDEKEEEEPYVVYEKEKRNNTMQQPKNKDAFLEKKKNQFRQQMFPSENTPQTLQQKQNNNNKPKQ